MSHLDNPDGSVTFNMEVVKKRLEELLGFTTKKAGDCVGKEVENLALNLNPGEVLLLENLRFHKEEIENEEKNKKVIEAQGSLNHIARQEFESCSPTEPEIDETVKCNRQECPEDTPEERFVNTDFMNFSVENSQVERQKEEDKTRKTDPYTGWGRIDDWHPLIILYDWSEHYRCGNDKQLDKIIDK